MGIILKNLRKKTMESFVNDIGQSNTYYVFMGKSDSWSNELVPDKELESVKLSLNDTRKNMMIGKKIFPSDTSYMIKKISWSTGTVYSQYDDQDTELYSKQFYVVNSTNDVFKCLWNNNGGTSTVEPTSLSVEPFTLSDGYTWKYMYSITSVMDQKFSTTNYVPVDTDSSVGLIDGSIDIVKINLGGNNYQQGIGTVQQVISSNLFRVDTSHPNSNGYFNGSSFYINNGSGLGSLADITAYVANSSGRFVQLSSNLTSVNLTSEYIISPKISFVGNGTGAKAYCTVNGSGSIDSVNMVDVGSGYDYCDVVVVSNTNFGTGASLSPIISPPGGHGSDPVVELGSDMLCISVDVDGSEVNSVNTAITFRQVGIISDVKYSNGVSYDDDTFDFTTINNLDKFSGDVLFYDNVTSVTRSNTSVETVRLILKF